MLFKTPEDTYRACQRFLKKRNFRKAYKCLESLLHQFPGDEALLVDIVNLAYCDWGNYEMARPWLLQLARMRSLWEDYALLSRGEGRAGNVRQARDYLGKAKDLFEKRGSISDKREAKAAFSEIEDLIRFHEWRSFSKPKTEKVTPAKEWAVPSLDSIDVRDLSQKEGSSKETASPKVSLKPESVPEATGEQASSPIPEYHIPVSFSRLETRS